MRQPLWYKDAIIYEVHVKSFFDSNDDGSGDFQGLTRKLDYLQELGITAIWLLPFYPSPQRDDGYDIADYRTVHPRYGSLRDFKQFVRQAHRRGIRVITELVVNHTSDAHPWFQRAREAKPGSAKRNYYVWSDTDTKYAGTRIIFTDTETSNWTWDPVAGAYYWHRFFSHQPDLNLDNPTVVKEMIWVLRFWLDMGVDGLRLDAVPYLCEREGTNNENLPETHAVIREMRRQVDDHYDDRMLLAEANQWPEDVCPYFGEGDECHMAFHFPLMPRIFMALRQEDRRPITEIMARTPEIPPSCQWALFLRNHDELTLEMVTDEERDYMYREYAKDARMRLNLGIRRRLAPLVENSRRRLELLNSLLFSFPGTPVVYYGDEIGMGDNIFLGDRDGVRTPMQWSIDRNAGFSGADPARLYLPPIMDPVYGYQAVSVEAQERSPTSLLKFMKRIIALRRQHKAFGRGTLEFLPAENRKILVYLRRYRKEVILAVVNLSRFVQPAELDLSDFEGWTPVEMMGRVEFPTIGKLPYFLTLGPHSFYWFQLEPRVAPVSVGRGKRRPKQATASGADPRAGLPRIPLELGIGSLFSGEALRLFETEILPRYLPKQRWFRSKARELAATRVADSCKLGAGFYWMVAEVFHTGGGSERYGLLLRGVLGKQARLVARTAPESMIASLLSSKGEEGVLFDAFADQTSVAQLLTAMTDERSFPTAAGGSLKAFHTRAFADERDFPELRGGPIGASRLRRLTAEQSNTSVIVDDDFILKFFRGVEAGTNPDMEIGLQLTERTDFRNFPPLAGGLIYREGRGEEKGQETTAAMLQWFVPNEGDGWSYTLKSLRKTYRRMLAKKSQRIDPPGPGSLLAQAEEEIPAKVNQAMGADLEAAARLGRRTAELHLALAGDRRRPAFRPEPFTAAQMDELLAEVRQRAEAAITLLRLRESALPESARAWMGRLERAGETGLHAMQRPPEAAEGGTRIRCHGDYHLGQVLRADHDFVLLDFEGEPMRPMAERRQKQSPLKDVAGMLRSYDYAAHAVVQEMLKHRSRQPEALESIAAACQAWLSVAYLREYLESASPGGFLPASRRGTEWLLTLFLLEKASYELDYELNNRPDWTLIPLRGMVRLLHRMEEAAEEQETETTAAAVGDDRG